MISPNSNLAILPERKPNDFFTNYMSYCNLDSSEAPAIYHRWVCASIIGALLGRQTWIQFGPHTVYPNQYIMLMGSPGARKGSAMGIGKALLKAAGYNRFASDKTSKERFLMDMKQFDIPPGGEAADLEMLSFDEPAESYVFSGEFTDFIGQNNMEFVTMLTNLWDNLSVYVNPKITGKSVRVEKPTVNLIGANTPEGFSLAFPPEALGNGFLSRVLMIFGEPNGNRIAWPEPLDDLVKESLSWHLKEVKDRVKGEMAISKEAKSFGNHLYQEEVPVDDPRFSHYQQRRFIHLLKLAMIMAATDMAMKVEEIHMRRANTMLAMAERRMPKALGEFGSSRYSVISGKILALLNSRTSPQSPNEILKALHTDISKVAELAEILAMLKQADKIQPATIKGKSGYLPKNIRGKEWPEKYLDLNWLTPMELI